MIATILTRDFILYSDFVLNFSENVQKRHLRFRRWDRPKSVALLFSDFYIGMKAFHEDELAYVQLGHSLVLTVHYTAYA